MFGSVRAPKTTHRTPPPSPKKRARLLTPTPTPGLTRPTYNLPYLTSPHLTSPYLTPAAASTVGPVPDPPAGGPPRRQAHPPELQQQRRAARVRARPDRPLREKHGGRGGGSVGVGQGGRRRGAPEMNARGGERGRVGREIVRTMFAPPCASGVRFVFERRGKGWSGATPSTRELNSPPALPTWVGVRSVGQSRKGLRVCPRAGHTYSG